MSDIPVDTRYFKALPEDEGVDDVRLELVPRWKESELSGDEWRYSVVVRFFRKGVEVKVDSFGSFQDAILGLGAMWQTRHEGSPVALWGLTAQSCAQFGCDREAVEVFGLKEQFSDRGEGPLPDATPAYRAFCLRHRTRGDCDREDCDTNHIPA